MLLLLLLLIVMMVMVILTLTEQAHSEYSQFFAIDRIPFYLFSFLFDSVHSSISWVRTFFFCCCQHCVARFSVELIMANKSFRCKKKSIERKKKSIKHQPISFHQTIDGEHWNLCDMRSMWIRLKGKWMRVRERAQARTHLHSNANIALAINYCSFDAKFICLLCFCCFWFDFRFPSYCYRECSHCRCRKYLYIDFPVY